MGDGRDRELVGGTGETDGSGTASAEVGTDGRKAGRGIIGTVSAPRNLIPLAIAAVGLVVGVILLLAASARVDAMTAVADDAVIVSVESHVSEAGRGSKRQRSVSYRPVLRFTDSDHVEHTAPSEYETSTKGVYRTSSETMSVRYDPRDADGGCVIVGEEGKARMMGVQRLIISVAVSVLVAIIVRVVVPWGDGRDGSDEVD